MRTWQASRSSVDGCCRVHAVALPIFEPSDTFGARLRRLRMAAGLTQRELAQRLHLTQPRISQIEADRAAGPLPLRTLYAIANVFGVTLEALTGGDPVYDDIDLEAQRDPTPPRMRSPRSFVELVGRSDDVERLVALVRDGEHLVTLVGPGGVGKTQLAIHVANVLKPDFPAGVCFVSLAPCHDAGCVVLTIARAAGLQEHEGLSLRTHLLGALPSGRLLIVLDNAEQAASPIGELTSELLAAYPDLTILVTSRTPLNLYQERLFPVSPLAFPRSQHAVSVAVAT